jgi:outer membrane immunogenic protein
MFRIEHESPMEPRWNFVAILQQARVICFRRAFIKRFDALPDVTWRFRKGGTTMGTSKHKLLCAIGLASSLLGLTAIAQAADLPPAPPVYKTPAVYAPPPFSWTGFYIGGNLGGGWSQGNITDSVFGLNFTNGTRGAFIGGGQVGGNYQINNFVVGAEADFDWFANNNNSGPGILLPNATTLRVSANNRWVTTLAARFGLAVDRVLIYAKGGGGWVGAGNFAVTNVGTGAVATVSNSNTNSGWLVGAGVEWAFAQNWTVKAEYDFLGLSNNSFTATVPTAGGPFTDTFSTRNRDVQMFTVGVNYLFNFGGY